MSVELPGFVDHHTHLLRAAAGAIPPYDIRRPETIAAYHRSCSNRSTTPMDEPHPYGAADLPNALEAGLRRAAALGLVQITEMGMDQWEYLDALRVLRDRDTLALRVRLYLASGLADVKAMQPVGDPWIEIEGVKFYADGWLGPRTCALCRPFADDPDAGTGVLFLDGTTLARRAEPFAEAGWRIATHAIGDRAIEAVLDGYELLFGSDCPSAAPRIEHAQVLQPHLIERMAHLGVVACIQPSFAVSDYESATRALDGDAPLAYEWAALLDGGVKVVTGSDYPIEPLSPLLGLQHLVTGARDRNGPKVAPVIELDQALPLMGDESCGVTVLDAHPSDVDPREIGDITVMDVRPAQT